MAPVIHLVAAGCRRYVVVRYGATGLLMSTKVFTVGNCEGGYEGGVNVICYSPCVLE